MRGGGGGKKRNVRRSHWLCAVALIFFCALPVTAEETPSPEEPAAPPASAAAAPAAPASTTAAPEDENVVHLSAQNGLKFDGGTKLITAEGGVRLTYRKITLEAERLRVDLDRDLLWAEGKVHYEKEKDKIDAERVVYDLNGEAGTFYGVDTTHRSDDLKGNVYVTGATMESGKDLLRLTSAQLTTCDLPDPHYHLEAKEITVYLKERLVARQVRYYEGKVRLFTLPYLLIPLKKENQFELPRVGYSQEDGWFIKTTYNYWRSSAAHGQYFLDWYQKQGFGLGLKHNYTLGQKAQGGSGSSYLYVKNNRTHDDEQVFAGVDHQQQFAPGWKGTWKGLYEDKYLTAYEHQELASNTLQLTEQDSSGFTSVSGSYRLQATTPLPGATGRVGPLARNDLRDTRLSLNTAQKLPLGWDWRFGASAARVQQAGRTPYDNLGYQTQLSRTFPDFTMRISAQQQFTPPVVAEGEPRPPWNRYSRLPELALESRTLTRRGRPLPLAFSASLSRYEEYSLSRPDGYALTMGSLTGRLTGLSYPLAKPVSLNLSGWGTATYYQNGEYTLGANTGVGVTYRPFTPLAATVRYTWQDRLGVNPFSSTGVFPAQTVAGSLTYSAGGLSADLNTAYDFLTDRYQDLVGRANFVRGKVSANGMVSFDPNTSLFRRASVSYSYQADERLLKVGATVDLADSELERLDLQAATPLSKLWRVEVAASWDGYLQSLSRGEVALTRDIHCREIRLRYDEVRREIWAELRIKALPQQLLRVGAAQNTLMFDTESLGLLSNETGISAGVPR